MNKHLVLARPLARPPAPSEPSQRSQPKVSSALASHRMSDKQLEYVRERNVGCVVRGSACMHVM